MRDQCKQIDTKPSVIKSQERREPQYVMGIDNGGTVSKAAIYDALGREVAVASQNTEMLIPRKGYTERDLQELWSVNQEVIRKVLKLAKIAPESIGAISVTGHGNGIYLVGHHGEIVYNGIISTDMRAEGYVEKWKKDGTASELFSMTMQAIWPGQPLALMAWLCDYEPQVLKDTKWVLGCKDYIRYRLTGEAYGEITDMSGMHLVNVATGTYDSRILELTGLEAYHDLLPPLIGTTEIGGYVTEEVATSTGLAVGTPVIAGCFDIDACALASKVVDEDTLCIIAGTWSINEYISPRPIASEHIFMTSIYAMEDYWLETEASPTSASNLEWFISRFMKDEKRRAMEEGRSIYDYCNGLVRGLEPEDVDLYFIPFLYGNNTDNPMGASFIGLSSYHKKAHMLRSVYEGVAFSHMMHIENLLRHRSMPKRIRISGGAARSKEWVQIFADLLQVPIETMKGSELGTLGAAICAGVGIGWYESLREAAEQMVTISDIHEPRQEKGPIYRQKYQGYKKRIELLSKLYQS